MWEADFSVEIKGKIQRLAAACIGQQHSDSREASDVVRAAHGEPAFQAAWEQQARPTQQQVPREQCSERCSVLSVWRSGG